MAATLITVYQQHLSPHKGFACAHRLLHGSESCSHYIKRTILEQGLSAGLPLIQQRFQDCQAANLTLRAHRQRKAIAAEPEPTQDLPDPGEALPDAPDDPAEATLPPNQQRRDRARNANRAKPPANAAGGSGNGDALNGCDTLNCALDGCDFNSDLGHDCHTPACDALNCDALDCGSWGDCGDCGSCGS